VTGASGGQGRCPWILRGASPRRPLMGGRGDVLRAGVTAHGGCAATRGKLLRQPNNTHFLRKWGCEGFQRAIAKPFGRAAARNLCNINDPFGVDNFSKRVFICYFTRTPSVAVRSPASPNDRRSRGSTQAAFMALKPRTRVAGRPYSPRDPRSETTLPSPHKGWMGRSPSRGCRGE